MDGTPSVRAGRRRQSAIAIRRARFPSRLGIVVAATLTLPLALLFLAPRAPQNGLSWDALMVAGFLGAALIAALPLVSPRIWHRFGGDPTQLRSVLFWHADLSYVAVALVVAHTLGIVVLDQTSIEYLKLSAPWSMLAAIVATLLLLALLVSSWYRINLGIRYRSWRQWHVALSLAATGLMTFHVIDAGYFVNSSIKAVVFIALMAGPSAMALVDGALARGHARAPDGALAIALPDTFEVPATRAGSRRFITLVCALLLIAVIGTAIPQAGSRPANEARACLAGECG